MRCGCWLAALLLIGASLRAQDKASVDQLAWLAGCWDGSTDQKQAVEQWMMPSGKMMLGMSRTVKDGKTLTFEFMRIHQEDNGDIYYTANPSGQDEASFKLTNRDASTWVFENPAHDFPQRIIYRQEADGSLTARIEGLYDGKAKTVTFPMKRAACP